MRAWTMLVTMLFAGTAGAADLALHPILGDAPPAVAEALEDEVRAALARTSQYGLQDAGTTRSELDVAVNMGVACAADDAGCLAKTAVVLQVDLLLVPRAHIEQGALVLELLMVDARTGSAAGRASGEVPLAQGDERARRVTDLVRRALLRREVKVPASSVEVAAASGPPKGESNVAVEMMKPPAPEEPEDVGLPPLLLGGMGTAALGGALFAVGTAGAIWSVLTLTTDIGAETRYEDRRLWQGVGQVSLATVAVGGVLVLVGGGVAGAALLE